MAAPASGVEVLAGEAPMSELGNMKRHWSQHGTSTSGDSLDLFGEENEVLRQVFARWDTTSLEGEVQDGRSLAPEKYDSGTLGKLALEHAAVRLAAERDMSRALSIAGRHDLEHKLTEEIRATQPLLARMDKLSRGVNPVSLAGDGAWVNTLSELRQVLQPSLLDEVLSAGALALALAEHRNQLHSAKFLRKHAPTHPAKSTWFNRLPFMVRLQTAYDRSRGFPWAESAPLASTKVAERYDNEAP